MIKNKIKSLEEVEKIILKNKKKKKKIILSHGVFDLLHIGHINHFEEAKKLGDILIVSITAKKYVKKIPGRPIFNDTERLKALSSLEYVDYVICNHDYTSINLIKKIKPNIYCKGPDYIDKEKDLTKNISKEIKAVKSVMGKIVFTSGKTYSSSKLLNQNFSQLSENTKTFIKEIKKKTSFEQLQKKLDMLKNQKILIIGESIVDEYIFCEGLGKSGKESVLSIRKKIAKKYLGGVLSVAQNCFTFSKNITVATYLGNNEKLNSFIKQKLNNEINFKYIKKINSPTIHKLRYLDIVDSRKLIGVYDINDDNLSNIEEKQFLKLLNKEIIKNDLIIVLDYGHGLLTEKISKLISGKNKFTSLNAQINSSNVGFHNLGKYKNIDSLTINATELRHEMRKRDGNVVDLGKKLKNSQNIKWLTITQGQAGAIMINNQNKVIIAPAFSNNVVDKIGAGDTLLGLLSMCLKSKLDENEALFLSSVAAGISTSNYANSTTVNKFEILNHIKYYLK